MKRYITIIFLSLILLASGLQACAQSPGLLLSRIVAEDLSYQEFSYDSQGSLVSCRFQDAYIEYYQYDDKGRLITVTRDDLPLEGGRGELRRYELEYNEKGMVSLTYAYEPNGDVWRMEWAYDNKNRIIGGTVFTNDVFSENITLESDENGNTTNLTVYDADGILIEEQKMGYDEHPNPVPMSDINIYGILQHNNVTSWTFRRETPVEDAIGYNDAYEYDENGLPLKVTRSFIGDHADEPPTVYTYIYISEEDLDK